jgi:hypothetical protein
VQDCNGKLEEITGGHRHEWKYNITTAIETMIVWTGEEGSCSWYSS